MSVTAAEFLPESIPAELKTIPRWLLWKLETRNGKPTKTPYQVSGALAKVNDPATFTDFDSALTGYRKGGFSGLGIALSEDDDLVGIDLDKVLNPDTGELDPEAARIVATLPTYCEVSPSGRGLRLFGFGKLPQGGRRKGQFEFYETGRYLTVTGNRFNGRTSLAEITPQLAEVHARIFGTGARPVDSKPADPFDLDDVALLDKARRARNGGEFERLWHGDTSAHGGDESAADLALCNNLAFWTGNDPARMDRLFRQSGLMRSKWDETHFSDGRTYGQATLDKAVAGNQKTYSGRKADPIADGGLLARLRTRESKNGETQVIPCLQNAVYLLSDTPEWRGAIGYNQFRQRIEKRRLTPCGGTVGPWSDWDTAETIIYLSERYGVAFARDTVDFAAMAVANRQAFNPAQDRLRALAEQWDGIDRLPYWLEEVLGAKVEENREYLAAIGAAWIKGVCARVLFPGCKRDDVLVLRSPQGWRKSTAAQLIADCIQPDSFTDSVDLNNLSEAKIQIRGVTIAELPELAGLSRGDVESIKAFVTTRSDRFREKFGRHAQDFHRTCSFIGTTNDPSFLKDPTGNRRWWPVTLEQPVDISRLEEALPQLIGEAARAVMAGEPWHVTGAVALRQAEQVRDAHYDEDLWTDEVMGIVASMDEAGGTVTIPSILDRMDVPRAQQNSGTNRRIAAILRTNNYEESRKWTDGKKRRLRIWKKIPTAY